MNEYVTVDNDTEIFLDGNKYLLQKGDQILITEGIRDRIKQLAKKAILKFLSKLTGNKINMNNMERKLDDISLSKLIGLAKNPEKSKYLFDIE